MSSATLRIARCPTLAKTAFRSSENNVADILARPSTHRHHQPHTTHHIVRCSRTSDNDRPAYEPNRRVRAHLNIKPIHNPLEKNRNLDVEHLSSKKEREGQDDSCLDRPLVFGPHVCDEPFDDCPIDAPLFGL